MGFFKESPEEKARREMEARLLRENLAKLAKEGKKAGKNAAKVVVKGSKLIKGGREIEVVEFDPSTGKSTTYRRPTDKKLAKKAEQDFKKRGSEWHEGTITGRGVRGNRPVNNDGSPRSTWW